MNIIEKVKDPNTGIADILQVRNKHSRQSREGGRPRHRQKKQTNSSTGIMEEPKHMHSSRNRGNKVTMTKT